MSWDDLKPVLLEQSLRQPSPLLAYPDPRIGGGRRAPFRIRLAAWASDLAAELHDRFDDEVSLFVGCLAYPTGERVDGRGRPWVEPAANRAPTTLIDAAELEVDLADDLEVVSGHDAIADLRVTSHARTPVELRLPAAREACIVDPDDGTVVGGLALTAPLTSLRALTVAPRATTSVPLVVGTASYSRNLGWAVPAGSWALRAFLQRSDGRLLRVPLLPLTVT